MRKVVSNTTPLIALCSIGRFDLLHRLYNKIIIPKAVLEEVKSEPAKTLINNSDWICVEEVSDISQKRMYRARLHSGEVEVMILAQEIAADLVLMDDNAAKKMAKYLGLTVTGTIGVLLRAKKESYIDSIKDALYDLKTTGFFVGDDLINYVLESSGEQ